MQRGIGMLTETKKQHPAMRCSAYERSLFDAQAMIRFLLQRILVRAL
jgi:hypothetical protein